MLAFTRSKINLGLDIVAKRPDGYHDLVTVMLPIDWGDILEIVPAASDATTLTVTGRPIDCPMEKNLVVKAYRALSRALPTPLPPVDIYLRKIVPDGAGLGGGSSDAATTLTLLRDLFDLDVTDDQLAAIADTLGADCPLFIHNRPMLATGTGTTLTPVDIPSLEGYAILVVKPPVGVSTAEAYAGVKPHPAEVDITEIISLPVDQWSGKLKNDFEPTITLNHLIIGDIKRWMLDNGADYAAMSGSGSAVFGLFRDTTPRRLPREWQSGEWSVWRSDNPLSE